MTDLSLRMPNTRLRAVLNLGTQRSPALDLPPALKAPELFGDWDDEAQVSDLYVEYADGQLHFETTSAGSNHHFHTPAGEHRGSSPWSANDTRVLLQWATQLASAFHALLPKLLDDITQATAWHDAGLDLYICEVEEPVQLDLLEIEVEGELLTLPWLGAGTVTHDHIEGENHPIALLWGAGESEPDQPIAQAWTDPRTGEPRSKAVPGIDWNVIGLAAEEVLPWLEGIYLNHHVIPDAAGTLLNAVLRRLGGLSSDRASS
ncbi:hypothetical protein I6E52_03120 [Salinibacterium sp. NG253]|uniref:hypothetical protein n=1 Tax=Salinibacterium sp. NG253 TaxID=2792039 RepID=UPI0018CC7E3D|nr:hypothetical protein [Salinibacterium sp. NG253]MBH0115832.1 hypothetical protein [Salinibacterium sp. NG253]